jgi:hypothetical protein
VCVFEKEHARARARALFQTSSEDDDGSVYCSSLVNSSPVHIQEILSYLRYLKTEQADYCFLKQISRMRALRYIYIYIYIYTSKVSHELLTYLRMYSNTYPIVIGVKHFSTFNETLEHFNDI